MRVIFTRPKWRYTCPNFFVGTNWQDFMFLNCFGIERGSNFTCPIGQVGWEVQLPDSYFQLSRAVGQSLMSIHVPNIGHGCPFKQIWIQIIFQAIHTSNDTKITLRLFSNPISALIHIPFVYRWYNHCTKYCSVSILHVYVYSYSLGNARLILGYGSLHYWSYFF